MGAGGKALGGGARRRVLLVFVLALAMGASLLSFGPAQPAAAAPGDPFPPLWPIWPYNMHWDGQVTLGIQETWSNTDPEAGPPVQNGSRSALLDVAVEGASVAVTQFHDESSWVFDTPDYVDEFGNTVHCSESGSNEATSEGQETLLRMGTYPPYDTGRYFVGLSLVNVDYHSEEAPSPGCGDTRTSDGQGHFQGDIVVGDDLGPFDEIHTAADCINVDETSEGCIADDPYALLGTTVTSWSSPLGNGSIDTTITFTFDLTSDPESDRDSDGFTDGYDYCADEAGIAPYGCPDENEQPVAVIEDVIPTDWRGPYALSFDASTSYDPVGGGGGGAAAAETPAPAGAGIASYSWDFGDGTTGSGEVVEHGYETPGTYDVILTVTDVDGATGIAATQVEFTGDPEVDFAPEVRLHPSEDWFPMHVQDFIEASALKWATDKACRDPVLADEGDVEEERLEKGAADPYRHKNHSGVTCKQTGKSYKANKYTRPNDGGKNGVEKDEGFYLDFETDDSYDTFRQVPVWTERRTAGNGNPVWGYWLFYSRSIPRKGGVSLTSVSHEGDWEHVNVELDATYLVPVRAWYFRHHGDPKKRAYPDDTERSEWLHPVAYSALTGHGHWYEAGNVKYCEDKWWGNGCLTDEFSDGGAVWQPWNDGNVLPVTSIPGYGFGGAWGAAGQIGDTTGPSGPPWKNPLQSG